MTYNTSITDALDDRLLDDGSIAGGRGAGTASDRPGSPRAFRKRPTSSQARTAAGHDGIKALMLDFTASAAKTEAGESHEGIAPATRAFLKSASFLARK